MILNTGQRTDIPAFYSEWFYNRLEAGYVLARNPYNPSTVMRYSLQPEVVDVIGFCTKNPEPMLPLRPSLMRFRQFWFVTITPYGRDIEPYVPDKHHLLEVFARLADTVGTDAILWRYDPVFLSERYTMEYHLHSFEIIAGALEDSTHGCVLSFLDLYEKTKRNFPQGRTVSEEDQFFLTERFAGIGKEHGITLYTCCESSRLAGAGAVTEGCMSRRMVENAIREKLIVPSWAGKNREGCQCLIGNDIGAYNSCLHGCRYCYANESRERAVRTAALHDPKSPFLIGGALPGDHICENRQTSWIDPQLSLFL